MGLTAAILAWSEGGMGVAPPALLRLLRRPVTDLFGFEAEGRGTRGAGGGRATPPSWGGGLAMAGVGRGAREGWGGEEGTRRRVGRRKGDIRRLQAGLVGRINSNLHNARVHYCDDITYGGVVSTGVI